MKKIILCGLGLILLILLCLMASCNKYVATNMYDKQYDSKELVYSDIYKQLSYYDIDSIPLDEWIPLNFVNDSTIIRQKFIVKPLDNKSSYQFIFTTYEYLHTSDTTYFFLIRFLGNEKYLQ